MANLLYELQKFVNEKLRLEKSVVNRYGATLFFTVKDGNILMLGSAVPSDAEDVASLPSYGKYILLIGKGDSNYDIKYEVEEFDAGVSRSTAQARAVQLTEANKNTVKEVFSVKPNHREGKNFIHLGGKFN